MADITVIKAAIEKEQMLLKLWFKLFQKESERTRNDVQFRDYFSKQEGPLFKGFGAFHNSCNQYSELITHQVLKQIEGLGHQCSQMLAKANELIRRSPDPKTKQATDRETVELRQQLQAYYNTKQQTIHNNTYLSLNYKLDIFCRGAEAETAILQALSSPTVDDTLKKIFG